MIADFRKSFRWLLLLVGFGGTLFACLAFSPAPAQAAAGINQQVNFQGRLLNSAGATVPDGVYNIEFKIYQDGDGQSTGDSTGSPAGSLKWTEDDLVSNSQGVTVKNGYLSVQLGSINPFGSSINWNSDTLWLSLNVGTTPGTSCTPFSSCSGDGEMTPMKRLSSSPYSLNSGLLGGLSSSQFVQLAQGLQTDASTTTNSIYINKTGSGNIIDLQSSGSDAFIVNNSGDETFGANANHTLSVATAAASAAGKSLTLAAGAAGTGGTTLAGGNLVLQGGAGGGTNGAGGNISLDAGVHNGSGSDGTISIGTTTASAISVSKSGITTTVNGNLTVAANQTFTDSGPASFQNATDSTNAFQVQNASGTNNLFIADNSNSRIGIGAVPANSLLTVGTNTTAASGGITFGTDTNLYRSGSNNLKTDGNLSVGTGLDVAGYTTSNTTNTNNGQWTQLGTCTITAQFDFCDTELHVLAGASGATPAYQATMVWRVKQQNALGGAPVIQVVLNNEEFITNSDIMAITTQNNGTSTIVQLWGRINDTFDDWHFTPFLTNNSSFGASISWLSNSGFTVTGSLPAGTQTTSVYNDANNATLAVVGTSTLTGNVGIGGASTTNQLEVTSGATAPTADQLNITNAGSSGVITAGVNGLSVTYKGGAAAVEAAGERIDLQPGTTSGGTWDGLRIVPNATGAVAGVTENGLKLDNLTTPGAGTENAINVGTGWDNILQSANVTITQAGAITAASTINSQTISSAASFTGTLAFATLGSATSNATVCRNSSNQLASCTTTGAGTSFVQGGNSFGTAGDLGTNDGNALNLRTNGSTRVTVSTTGDLTFAASNTIGTSLTNGNLTLQANGTGTTTIDTTGTGSINIGADTANAKTISLGPTATNTGTTTYNLGVNTAGSQLVRIGSTGSSNAAAGTLVNIQGGTTANTAVTIGTNGAGGITVGTGSTGAINLDTGTTGSILIGGGTTSAKTISIGPTATNTNATTYNLGVNTAGTQAINVGSAGSSNAAAGTTLNLQGGTTANTAVTIGTNGAGGITVGTGSTGNINIDTGTTGSILIGGGTTGNPAKTISIGPVNTDTGTTTYNFGVNGAGAQVVKIGSTNASSTISIQGGTAANAISIGTAATQNQVLIGSATSGSTTTLQGVNGISLSGNATTSGTSIFTGLATANGGLTVNTATASDISVTSGASVPTADQLNITNAGSGGVTTAGVNALSINYKGGAAAVEAAAQRIDLQPGATSGGTWDGLRFVANGTGPATGVTETGLKVEGPTTAGAGTFNAFNVANIGAVTTGGTVNGINLTGTNSQAAGIVNAININNLTGGGATETAINIGTGWDNILSYNGASLINSTGLLQSAAVSGAYANLTGTGALASGSIASGFGVISTGNNITTSAALQGGTAIVTGANGLTLGTSSSLTGGIVFKGSGGTGTLTLAGPTTPNAGNFTLSLPAITANDTVCTNGTLATACANYAPAAGANYIAKNTNDTSSASFVGSLLGLTNSNTAASGVLSLTGNGTNSDLSILHSGTSEPGVGQALIQVNNNTTTPTGNLIDLQNKGSSKFSVDVAGNITNNGNISLGGTSPVTIQSTAANGTFNVDANGTGALNLDTTGGGTVNVAQNAVNLNLATTATATTIGLGNTTAATTTLINGGTGGSAISLQAGAAGTISIGTTNINTVTVGSTANTGTLIFGRSTAGETINIGNGNVASGDTNTINIGATATSTGKDVVTIGSSVAASSLTLQSGTGNLSITSQGTGTLGVGNNAVAQNIAVGNTTAATVTTIQGGTGGTALNLQVGAGGTLNVGTTSQTSTLNLGNTSASATTLINGGTGGSAISLQAAATGTILAGTTNANTVDIGSTGSGNAAAGTLINIQGGTTANTAVTIGTNGAGGITIATGTTGGINLDTGTTGSILIGGGTSSAKTISIGPINTDTSTTTYNLGINGAGAQLVSIGSTNASSTISIQGGTAANAISIGTATTLNKILLGSVNGASTTTLQAGTGGIALSPSGGTGNTGVLLKPGSNTVAAFQIQPAASATPVLAVDTTNLRVGINTAAPTAALTINSGTANVSGLQFTQLTNASPSNGAFSNILGLDSSGNLGVSSVAVSLTSPALAYWDGINDPTTGSQSYPLATVASRGTTTFTPTFGGSGNGEQLTQATNNETGTIDWSFSQVPFEEVQFQMKAGTGSADGTWFYSYADGVPTTEYGAGGAFTKGYIIYFGEFHNCVGIAYGSFTDGNQCNNGGGTSNAGTSPLVSVSKTGINDNNWHDVDIQILQNKLIVRWDGQVLLTYSDVYTRDTSKLDFGFGARTGGQNNTHFIKDLLVTKLGTNVSDYNIDNTSPLASNLTWDNVNSRLGINTSTPAASFEDDGDALFKSSATTTFQVQNAGGNDFLQVNGSTSTVSVGDTSIASTVQVGNSSGNVAQTVNVGNNTTGTTNVNIGNLLGSSTTTIQSGTSGSLNLQTGSGGTINIGTSNVAKTIDIGAVGSTAQNTTLHIGDSSAGIQTITIGSGNSTSDLTLQGGNITTTNNQGGVDIGGGFSSSDTNLVPFVLDSTSTLSETANTCTASVNDGTLYYNSNAGSNSIRACINGGWEDLISTAGAFFDFFGVVPDSGTVPGDIQALSTAAVSGPCRVSWASGTTVAVSPCIAYSGGRKVNVAQTTVTLNTQATNNIQHICLSGTNNQPASSTGNATETANLGTVSFPSATGPIVCLADVKDASATTIGAIYDTRMYTTTTKEFGYSAAALPIGVMVKPDATNPNRLALPGTTATGQMRGVVVASNGAAWSSGGPNVIIATAGLVGIKATAGSTSTTNTVQNSTTTSGYALTAAASTTLYANIGIPETSFVTTCTTAATCTSGMVVVLDIH